MPKGIWYQEDSKGFVRVYLDKRRVGTIMKEVGGFRYHAFGSKGHKGELFNTIELCKQSLKGE